MIEAASVDAVLAIFLPLIQAHREKTSKPFVLGVSGLQGSGKSTWAGALSQALTLQHKLKTRTLSLDDLYFDHAELIALRDANLGNGLLQTRGQPGTHDVTLAQNFFDQIRKKNGDENRFVKWPAYDKSIHSGQGGRVPLDRWEEVSLSDGLDVLIFEGWCLGFQPLADDQITQKWTQAKDTAQQPGDWLLVNTLPDHDVNHLQLINQNLASYCDIFTGPQHFDGFVHLSTDKLFHVYEWRLSQEHAMKRYKPGMSDEQVVQFVRGYMPAYELFLERLQNENFFYDAEMGARGKNHIQIVLDRERNVVNIKNM